MYAYTEDCQRGLSDELRDDARDPLTPGDVEYR